MLLDQTMGRIPVARITVKTPFLTGTVDALCMDNPIYDLTIGNVEGSRLPTMADFKIPLAQAVETRAQTGREKTVFRKLIVPESISGISRDDFKQEQERDESIRTIVEKITSGAIKHCKRGGSSRFVRKNGLIHREFSAREGKKYWQVVVPQRYRSQVLRVAHESSMAGHLGKAKTTSRVVAEFYWPGVNGDVTRFCRSCDVCQKTVCKGRVTRVPLRQMPLIDTPFKRVAVDIVGPIHPVTERKNRYILTLVDYATRYPEAVALPTIETERVAEALVDIFSRVGVPEEILTDCGAQFTSDLMGEISRLLSIKQLNTTPYHPMCNGLVEKFNGTLKSMLRKMCAERPQDWDRYLNAVLFAYREVPQESLGFSPFELLYGRTVRGPMRILRELWTGE
jgi:transposase InsO family protein